MSDPQPRVPDDDMKLSRRDLFKGAGLGAMGILGVQAVSAQTDNEPRINLGDNFYIDDVDGDTLAVKDAQDGTTLLEWTSGSGWSIPGTLTVDDLDAAVAAVNKLSADIDADGNDITNVGSLDTGEIEIKGLVDDSSNDEYLTVVRGANDFYFGNVNPDSEEIVKQGDLWADNSEAY